VSGSSVILRDPALARRLRVTAAIVVAVMVGLAVFAALYIVKNGRRSHTVLHSERYVPALRIPA
jgi:hypothetical protein